jgi:hypothetical protein
MLPPESDPCLFSMRSIINQAKDGEDLATAILIFTRRLLRNAMLSMNRGCCCFGSDPDESWFRSQNSVSQTDRSLTS